jgi:hypothetical protein
MIGKIVDAMCNCYEDISKNALGRSSTMSRRRFEEFASKLRRFLRAKHCVTEWITLQLLNLSHGQGGELHMDVSNDPREGYNHTMCFCLHFTDNLGDLWSLKIITGYRKKIGDWMSLPYGKLIPLKLALLLHSTEIDDGYKDILLREYKGQYIPSVLPSWKDQKFMWLDDDMPYDIKVLKVGVNVFVFKMKTSPTLSYWLSPALTGAHRLSPYTCFRGMIQLAVVAACQNSFENYYVVTQEMLKLSMSLQLGPVQHKYPLITYCETCALLFNHHGGKTDEVDSGLDFVGGNYSPPRYPPVSFDIRMLVGSGDDTSKVDLLVDELIKLIDSVNTILDSLVLAVGRSTLEPLLNATSNRVLEILPGLEMVPFRLLLFLEFCAHLNVGLTTGTKKIRDLLYPVSGTASHRLILKHVLADKRFKDRDPCKLVDDACSFLKSELSSADRQAFMDEIEPMLCEAMPSDEYRWGGNDTFIKGQSLFRINEHGVPFVRSYGKESEWMPILPKAKKK